MKSPADAPPLDRPVASASRYGPELLFAIARAPQRAELGITGSLPFCGVDIWNAYEVSWLDADGKPRVALAEIRVPADSPNLIESKSLKLYLNSFAQERMAGADAVRALMMADLGAATGAAIDVSTIEADRFSAQRIEELEGESIDTIALAIDDYGPPNPDYLQRVSDEVTVEETLVSHLLKSNCPVTGQPDWASVQVHYSGPRIDRAGLLRYLVSFRHHAGFHEHCVERIYMDLARRCTPSELTVSARYTRRGGIDINPWRSHSAADVPNPRGARQ
ncbi:MAG: NADPH-dependent 7-cyano-7-deazaguanine reductase QueF [Rhodanobacteraceae bacterium]